MLLSTDYDLGWNIGFFRDLESFIGFFYPSPI